MWMVVVRPETWDETELQFKISNAGQRRSRVKIKKKSSAPLLNGPREGPIAGQVC